MSAYNVLRIDVPKCHLKAEHLAFPTPVSNRPNSSLMAQQSQIEMVIIIDVIEWCRERRKFASRGGTCTGTCRALVKSQRGEWPATGRARGAETAESARRLDRIQPPRQGVFV